MAIELKNYSQHTEDFWLLMGPIFASRAFVKEMGGWQFYAEDNDFWVVATEGGNVVGFGALYARKGHQVLDNLFVLPEFRQKGVSKKILTALLRGATGTVKLITSNANQVSVFKSEGFVETGTRGSYTKMERVLN